MKIRNVAIVAHVDHGKTTLVDEMMKFCRLFRDNQEVQECFLDSNDQERERGITILAKNISLTYKDVKINLIDTPGHADFSGEVERVLKMADGVLLLVDSHDGVMPQTRFVLRKALENKLSPVVVLNKMDRSDAQPKTALDSVYDLFMDLNVEESLLDFPVLYASGRSGWASNTPEDTGANLEPLLEAILQHIPEPPQNPGPLQMQVTSYEHSDYLGRIAIGRVYRGTLKKNQQVKILKAGGEAVKAAVKQLFVFRGLEKEAVDQVETGDLCAVVGMEAIDIGDTLADPEQAEALPGIPVEEPTLSMMFTVNDSPLYGREGKYVTSRHVKDYLYKAQERDVSIRVEKTDLENAFRVYGRGILHLSVLIENMRRGGYELSVGQPEVVYKEVDGVLCEPIEHLVVEVQEAYAGKAIESVARHKGDLKEVHYTEEGQIQTYYIPSRGLIGLRTELLNGCSGNIVVHHRFLEYQPKKGNIEKRSNGVMVSLDKGQTVAYALANLQDRGTFFVAPGETTYLGMIVGEHCKADDIDVNLQKEKKLSNMRSAGKDRDLKIAPPVRFSLEQALEFVQEDEWVEITPQSVRLRKKILDPNQRKRSQKQATAA